MRFNVTVCTKEGSTIHHAFDEIHDSLCWSLSALGHEVSKTENWFSESGETNIILGPELIADFVKIPANSVIVNLEQKSHPRLESVRRLSKGLPVWDFSKGTEKDWPDARQVIHLSVGFTPNLVHGLSNNPNPDIDVFFAGWMTQRRREFLDSLRAEGIKVFAAGANCYGGVRDELLSRTKLAINIHHDGRDQFEIVRCSYLMANVIPVVTEPSSDDIDYEDLAPGMVKAPIRIMKDFIHSLLNSDKERQNLAEEGHRRIKNRDFTQFVASVLDATDLSHNTPSRPLEFKSSRQEKKVSYLEQGRQLSDSYPVNVAKASVYKRYSDALEAGDMKDFVQWLRSKATGNIVEIGVRDGASTSAFLAGVSETYGHVYSIDINPDCGKLFSGHPNWTFIHANSQDHGKVLPLIPEEIDFLLIDGDHSYEAVRTDFLYHQRVRDGGYVALHDICPEPWTGPGPQPADYPNDSVKRFWEELTEDCAKDGWHSFVVPGRYGLGVIQKIAWWDAQTKERIANVALPCIPGITWSEPK